ncbi:MAG TPA: TraB/GumN family protein [Rhizomicrobium sp.]|nr:TraB/GumN family protein [Rhizomicrobium sp.]
MWKTVALALALFAVSLGVAAQTVPDWAEIESIEVRERPGPALWHLTRGVSEVWILGMAGAMPKDLDWNKEYLSELLDGARAILMPPKADIALTDIAWFLIRHGSKLSLPRGQTLEDSLPGDLRARFVAVRDTVSDDVDDYRTDIPIRAAMRLQQDARDKNDLSFREPRHTIETFANRKRIPVAPVTRFAAMDAVRDIFKLTPSQQHVCLAQALEDVTWALGHAGTAARAWAVGDIKTVKAHYSEWRLGNCVIGAVQKFGDIDGRNIAEYVSAIDKALDIPGKTIVVIHMGPLLRKNGVLERLQARGIAVEGPAE